MEFDVDEPFYVSKNYYNHINDSTLVNEYETDSSILGDENVGRWDSSG